MFSGSVLHNEDEVGKEGVDCFGFLSLEACLFLSWFDFFFPFYVIAKMCSVIVSSLTSLMLFIKLLLTF